MDELGNIVNSPGGVVGAVGAAILAGAMFLRKYWLSDKVEKEVADKTASLIASLSDQLDKAHARAEAADKRADDATKEVERVIREMADMRAEISTLTRRVEEQNRLITEQTVQIQSLRGH